MNEDDIFSLKRFCKMLDEIAVKCGRECDTHADLIRSMIIENDGLNRAIATLEAAHKTEKKHLENHFFNGVHHVHRLPNNGQAGKNASSDNPPDHAS